MIDNDSIPFTESSIMRIQRLSTPTTPTLKTSLLFNLQRFPGLLKSCQKTPSLRSLFISYNWTTHGCYC